MGILNIIWGSIWVLIGLCAGAQPFIFYNFPLPQPGGGKTYPYRGLYDLLKREVPAYVAVETAHVVLLLVLAVLLIIAGVGLLRMKNWSRSTSIFYGVVTVLSVIAYSIFSWIYITPVSEAWTKDFLQKQPAGTPNFGARPEFAAVAIIASLVFSLAYPIVLVVIMFLPNVRAAFAVRDLGPGIEEEGQSS
jgi:hypothetical protein